MTKWVEACSAGDIEEEDVIRFDHGGRTFAVYRSPGDEYYATGAAFTVVAWGFAYLFAVVQVVWPESFTNSDGFGQSWFELLYLSFSTLTSVGLSDIVAVGAQARSVVMIEMMVGVFYIAMVVARMVGLTMMRHRR